MNNYISISLSATLQNRDDVIQYLTKKSEYIHFNIMDDNLLMHEKLDYNLIKHIKDLDSNAKLDVHINSLYPCKYIGYCIKNCCDIITIQAESQTNISQFICNVKEAGLKAGLAIKPSTDIKLISKYLDQIDLINVMTVDPFSSEPSFQKKELNKIIELNRIKKHNNYSYLIEVEGYCNSSHYYMMKNSGADIFVVGKSGLFALDKSIEKAWDKMQEYMLEPTKIYLNADLVGNPLKEAVKDWLLENNYIVHDLYTDGTEEYPECARNLAKKVVESKNNFGILFCGTGLGMSMVANRINNVRAAVVSDCYSAKMAREHNDANVLCMGSRVVTKELACLIVEKFFNSSFLYGKHTARVDRFENIN